AGNVPPKTCGRQIFRHGEPDSRARRTAGRAGGPTMNVAVSATAISAVSSVSTDTFGTGWPAVIDGCHDLLAVAFGTNSMDDTFERACREADRASRPQDPRILRARRLLADDISLERAYYEILRDRPAPESLIDALVFSLRRGPGELIQRDTLRRLSAL